MEKRRVVITGLGTVNPLGNTTAESWAAAKAGKCGIGPITQFDASEFKCKLAAEVKNFDPETVVDKQEARKMARFTLLALGAAAEATDRQRPGSGRRGRTHRCQRVQRHRRPAHHRGAAQPVAWKREWKRSAPTSSPWPLPTWQRPRSPSASASRECAPARSRPARAAPTPWAMLSTASGMAMSRSWSAAVPKAASARWASAALPA